MRPSISAAWTSTISTWRAAHLSGAGTPGDSLRVVYGSQAGKGPGSRNIAGIADPAVDALVERIANAGTREELVFACRALDRVLRANRYWVPMWFKGK